MDAPEISAFGQQYPSRLPRLRSPFIGRERDVGEVVALLCREDVPLVTLTGPGGVGKTRLALQAAEASQHAFADGVLFVPLASVLDPALVLPAVARAMGVRETAGPHLLDLVMAALEERETLLLLDNFEHVAPAAPVVADLLSTCSRLTILTTSREHLQVSGEHEYPVAPLIVPERHGTSHFVDLAAFDAIRLFVARAKGAKPDFVLTGENAPIIADICRRLDGLPLAIELAAARIKVLPPAALQSRLERALPLLVGGGRDVPEHQRTMRTTIAWSYQLLSATEQRFFRHLAVFTGGFTLEAFEAVCHDVATSELDPLAALTSLVDKSLVRPVDSPTGSPRYMMLETIREYAEERLIESKEEVSARQHHAGWCVSFVEAAPAVLYHASHTWDLTRLQEEHPNLHAAMRWVDASGDIRTLLRIIAKVGLFWYLTGREPEGLEWHRRALAGDHDDQSSDYIAVLIHAGLLAQTLNDPSARSYLEAGRALAQAADNVLRQAEAALILGILDEDSGNYGESEAHLVSAEALARQADLLWTQILARYHLGVVAYGRGEREQARATLEEAQAAARDLGDLLIPVWTIRYLVLIACEEGDVDHATAILRQAKDFEHTGMRRGDIDLASGAVLAAELGEWASAARLLGAAMVENHDVPFALPERTAFARAEISARQGLGEDEYARHWQAGRHARRDELVTELDRVLTSGEKARTAEIRGDSSVLTPREREVLRLLIEGKSNREVAEALFISPRTATTHVTNILAKFGVETRAAAVTYAFQHDLA